MLASRLRPLLAAPIAAVAVLGAEPPFTPLFNGRDLSGWINVNCAPETFTVRDGMIHCDGIPTGALRTVRTYTNFVLELEWRHLKPGGNAGVFIWSRPLPAVGQPFLRSIEVQVLDHAYGKSDWFTTHGDVFPIHGARMKPFAPNRGDRSFPRESRSKGSPEWNHYRIVATNGVLRLSVNGAEVSGGTDCVDAHGHIALESEGGIVDWRNLRIQELPSPAPATPATGTAAPAASDWDSLYDGRSLRGWTGSDAALKAWRPSDWTLHCPRGTTNAEPIWCTTVMAAGEIFLDWKWETQPDVHSAPPLVLRAANGTIIPMPASWRIEAGKWNRLRLRRTDIGFDLTRNDEEEMSMALPRGPVQIGLKPTAFGVTVSSVFAERLR